MRNSMQFTTHSLALAARAEGFTCANLSPASRDPGCREPGSRLAGLAHFTCRCTCRFQWVCVRCRDPRSCRASPVDAPERKTGQILFSAFTTLVQNPCRGKVPFLHKSMATHFVFESCLQLERCLREASKESLLSQWTTKLFWGIERMRHGVDG